VLPSRACILDAKERERLYCRQVMVAFVVTSPVP